VPVQGCTLPLLDKGSDQFHAPGRFTPGEKEVGTILIEGCVVTRATPDVFGGDKNLLSCRYRVPDRPVPNLITVMTLLSRLHKIPKDFILCKTVNVV